MVSSGTPTVQVESDDRVVELRLNRPDALNALNPELVGGLYAALSDLANDDRGILVTGAGRATCAGMDTDLVGGGDYPEAYPDLHARLGEAYQLLDDRAAPSAVAGRGALIGAGFALSLRCDFLVVGTDTTISLPEIRYDIPVLANAERLADLVGPRIAKEIALLGDDLEPDRLGNLGLANAVVAESSVEDRARELVETAAGHDRNHVAAVLEQM